MYNAEAVDTRTQHHKRVVDSAFYLLADHALDLFVGRTGSNLILEFERSEDRSQLGVRINLAERGKEQGNKVVTAGFLLLLSESHGTIEVLARVVAAQCAKDVRDTHFHCYVHTALEVKTKIDLFLAALFQRVAEPHFLRGNRVQIEELFCLVTCSVLCGFFLVVIDNNREREIESANQEQQHCKCSYNSFVLHNYF